MVVVDQSSNIEQTQLPVCRLRFTATVCLAVLLALLFELDFPTSSEEEEEDALSSLVGKLLCQHSGSVVASVCCYVLLGTV